MASAKTAVISKTPKVAKRVKTTQGTTGITHDEFEGVPERDETEERLEKLIFGDEAGFLSGLQAPTARKGLVLRPDSNEEASADEEDGDFEDLPDDELFFLDSGTGEAPLVTPKDHEHTRGDKDQPAWIDSDDDRLTVSLASNTRLRKLRDTEADDIISGREYIRRLRRQYERLHPTPAWVEYARKRRKISKDHETDASDSDVSMEDSDSLSEILPLSSLLRSGGQLVNIKRHSSSVRRKLRPEVIDIQRTKDVAGHGASSVDTLQFHPYYPLLLSAGPSSTVHLHYISPQPPNPNPLLTSLHMKGTPLHTAAFCCPRSLDTDPHADPTRIFLSARRRYFHTWSLASGSVSKISRPMYGDAKAEQRTMENFKLSPCGRYMGLVGSARKGGGSINVLSTETMQWVCSCRIDSIGGVADFAWWRNGDGFTAVGKNGEVSEYDVESASVVMRWIDEGAVGTTVIALGGDGAGKLGGDRWVAIGSSSGIVNIYDRKELKAATSTSARPKAAKSFDQLTTPTSHLVFSVDGQMLVLASRWKRDALRLVHLPSCTVYRNWPTDKTPLGRVASVAVSPDGMYLAVGNEQGKIRLWEIRE
jgi:U3 small nucleolar RNA-associated protein 18